MIKALLTALIFLFAISQSSAQEYEVKIAEAERLGQLLHAYDSAAWGATDALLADKMASAEFFKSPIGYLTLDNGNGTFSTAFVVKGEAGPIVKVDVITRGKSSLGLKLHPKGRKLGVGEALQFAAKGAALRESFEPCQEFTPMNTVVIPGDDDDLFVYIMSATKEPNLIVFGRHYKFRVKRNDVTETTQFTNSCLGIPTQRNGVGAITSHSRTPYPQEHHVFANLSHKLPVFVTTTDNDRLWKIENGKISEIQN